MHIFSGIYKSRKILSPKGNQTRPTSGRLRETLFNICQHKIENATFLDLFAGSGAMGLEALSRGAKYAKFVDNNRDSIRCIQTNLTSFEIKEGEALLSDVFDAMKKLAKLGKTFDIIYADPPYQTLFKKTGESRSFSTEVIKTLEELIDLKYPLLNDEGDLFLEDALESLPDQNQFNYFVLKSLRKNGRSGLQHWRYK